MTDKKLGVGFIITVIIVLILIVAAFYILMGTGPPFAPAAIKEGRIVDDNTIEYMKIRQQFGRPIGSFQALKHRVSTLKIGLEAASGLCGYAAEMMDAGDAERAVWASSAKFYACDTYVNVAAEAVQLHGGIGYTWEHECHLYLKRARLNQVLFGTSNEHKDEIAERVFMADASAV